MKKQAYLLQVNQPCREQWAAMTPTEQGNYCQRCAKNVIDFSTKSDAEIIRILKGSKDKVCGRLNVSQLNRLITAPEEQRSKSPFYKALAGALLFSSAEVAATGNLPEQPTHVVSSEPKIGDTIVAEAVKQKEPLPSDSIPKVIKGTVVDSKTGEPLIACSIVMKDNKAVGTVADIDGNFSLTVPDNLFKDSMVFIVSYVGYETKEFTVLKKDFYKRNKILLKVNMEIHVLGGMGMIIVEPVQPPVEMFFQHYFR